MSSSGSIPLTINVEPQLKEDFITLCDRENISLTSAIQEYMRRSIDGGTLVSSYCSSNHFRDREIETLKNWADSYSESLKNFISLQKRVSRLEQVIKRTCGI